MRMRHLLQKHPATQRLPLALGRHLEAAVAWLLAARGNSRDGGIPAHYDLLRRRWAPSYPETTGYTIPTLLQCSTLLERSDLKEVALACAGYLLAAHIHAGGV